MKYKIGDILIVNQLLIDNHKKQFINSFGRVFFIEHIDEESQFGVLIFICRSLSNNFISTDLSEHSIEKYFTCIPNSKIAKLLWS